MKKSAENSIEDVLKIRDQFTVVVEDIRSSIRMNSELLSLLNDRQDRFEERMDRMEGTLVAVQVKLLDVENTGIATAKKVAHIYRTMVTRKEFDALDGRVRVLENKIA